MDFRFVDGNNQGQVPFALAVHNDGMLQRNGKTVGHLVHLGDDPESRQGNELQIVRPMPVAPAEDPGQVENAFIIGRIEIPHIHFVLDKLPFLLRQGTAVAGFPLGQTLFQSPVHLGPHRLVLLADGGIADVAEPADGFQGHFLSGLPIIEMGTDIRHLHFQPYPDFFRMVLGGVGKVFIRALEQMEIQGDPDGLFGIVIVVFRQGPGVGHIGQEPEEPAFADVVLPHQIIGQGMEGHGDVFEISVILDTHTG